MICFHVFTWIREKKLCCIPTWIITLQMWLLKKTRPSNSSFLLDIFEEMKVCQSIPVIGSVTLINTIQYAVWYRFIITKQRNTDSDCHATELAGSAQHRRFYYCYYCTVTVTSLDKTCKPCCHVILTSNGLCNVKAPVKTGGSVN